MRPLVAALLLCSPSAPIWAGQIEAPVSGDFNTGTQTGVIGTALGAPSPISLSVPSLAATNAPSLASALSPAPNVVTPAALTPKAAAPSAAEPIPALPVSAVTPNAPAAARGLEVGVKSAAFASLEEPGTVPDAGRAMFDRGRAAAADVPAPKTGAWSAIKSWIPFGESAPAWPGKAGDTVHIGRIKTTLASVAGEGGTSKVWKSGDRQFAIKILHPGALALPGVRDEAVVLRAVANTDLPVAKLLAESKDGRVLVKEFIEGATASQLLERGPFSRSQAEGWPEMVAKLIRRGVTADLARGNLVWQHWRSRWVLVDGGSLEDGAPKAVLDQTMTPELLAAAGIDPVAFLSGLRARLGPDTKLWARTRENIARSPKLAPALAALAAYDAGAKQAPDIVFSPAPKGSAVFDDSVVKPGELKKRLGFNPHDDHEKTKLHGDDPGKLNTVILKIEAKGHTPVVFKQAQWSIIRNEVAMRRIVRRFFGRYVRTPASLAVENGWESYMVMEKLDASPSFYKDALNREQRVAMAILARVFGLGDVNQGNVLSPSSGLPWLIDFEVAFGRATPNATMLPDERIALEMPWMSRHVANRVEDYQPAIRAWRALLAKSETRSAILADLKASGHSAEEADALLARFDLNTADLDWTLQNDADFVNQFVNRNAAPR